MYRLITITQTLQLLLPIFFGVLSCSDAVKDNPVWDNPLDSSGDKWDPPTVQISSDTNHYAVYDSITVTAIGTDSTGSISFYIWSTDIEKTWPDTTLAGTMLFSWADSGAHRVYVKAVDNDGVLSQSKSKYIYIDPMRPTIESMNDVMGHPINDTLMISALGIDANGTIQNYTWSFDSGATWIDTTAIGSIAHVWNDVGEYQVRVIAIDNHGLHSPQDRITITISQYPPTVIAMEDVFSHPIHDSLSITAEGTDSIGSVVHYIWSSDSGKTWSDTTTIGSNTYSWPTEDTYAILVKASDDDGGLSKADTVSIEVLAFKPILTLIPNDTLSQTDTFTVIFSGSDENGSIEKYLIDIDRDSIWDDSLADGAWTYAKPEGGTVTFYWGARDDDGEISSDTVSVIFNTYPSLDSLRKTNTDSWDSTSATANLYLQSYGSDSDFRDSTLHHHLVVTKISFDSTNNSGVFIVPSVDTSTYISYRLTISDLYGDSVTLSDSVLSPPPPSCTPQGANYFTDSRDGIQYGCVAIGSQVWFSENLNYNSGDSSYCYNDDLDNCSTYGRLYTWPKAMGGDFGLIHTSIVTQGVCPDGWHIPNSSEWGTLESHGGTYNGPKFRTPYGWQSNNGTDQFGFSALPGGYKSNNNWSSIGNQAYWWSTSATAVQDYSIYSLLITWGSDNMIWGDYSKHNALSVRCLRDSLISGDIYILEPKEYIPKSITELIPSSLNYSTFIDPRDSTEYYKTTIGTQTWMAENLSYAGGTENYCYSNVPENCDTYGNLYTWGAALNSDSASNTNPSNVKGICPPNWHLPSDSEWVALGEYAAAESGFNGKTGSDWTSLGYPLKSTSDWYNGTSGSDRYKFNAKPYGARLITGAYINLNEAGTWLSSSTNGTNLEISWRIQHDYHSFKRVYIGSSNAYSVRCVENSTP